MPHSPFQHPIHLIFTPHPPIAVSPRPATAAPPCPALWLMLLRASCRTCPAATSSDPRGAPTQRHPATVREGGMDCKVVDSMGRCSCDMTGVRCDGMGRLMGWEGCAWCVHYHLCSARGDMTVPCRALSQRTRPFHSTFIYHPSPFVRLQMHRRGPPPAVHARHPHPARPCCPSLTQTCEGGIMTTDRGRLSKNMSARVSTR